MTIQTPETESGWKNGYLWLIVAGPLAVVLAGLYTLWLAVSTPDPLVAQDYYRRGVALEGKAAPELAPAQQARNHAATPVVKP